MPRLYASAAMDLGLNGRTAIVLGASHGLGLAIAQALSAEGAGVAMFARRADVLEREAARIGALAVCGDLTRAGDLERLVEVTVESFGGVDVLMNNAGIQPGSDILGPRQNWEKVLAVNLSGAFYLVRSFFVETAVPGWTTIAVLLAVFNGITIALLSMLGEYVVRTLNAVSAEESYHVMERVSS